MRSQPDKSTPDESKEADQQPTQHHDKEPRLTQVVPDSLFQAGPPAGAAASEMSASFSEYQFVTDGIPDSLLQLRLYFSDTTLNGNGETDAPCFTAIENIAKAFLTDKSAVRGHAAITVSESEALKKYNETPFLPHGNYTLDKHGSKKCPTYIAASLSERFIDFIFVKSSLTTPEPDPTLNLSPLVRTLDRIGLTEKQSEPAQHFSA